LGSSPHTLFSPPPHPVIQRHRRRTRRCSRLRSFVMSLLSPWEACITSYRLAWAVPLGVRYATHTVYPLSHPFPHSLRLIPADALADTRTALELQPSSHNAWFRQGWVAGANYHSGCVTPPLPPLPSSLHDLLHLSPPFSPPQYIHLSSPSFPFPLPSHDG